MSIPFVDLKAQFRRIESTLRANLDAVLDHCRFIGGAEINVLEKRLAGYCGLGHGVACSSGTDALLLALMALGVKPGDAVLTTPFTFIATAEVIALLGAVPVFVDIDPSTYNIDPTALEQAIAAYQGRSGGYPLPTTAQGPLKGIIAVDMFGLCAEYDRLADIAAKNGLWLVEDGAQSFGATFQDKKACSFGHIACTSFFPAKPLGCYGDGGMCFTNDADLAALMRSFLNHGMGTERYEHVRIGLNGRLDTMQAAILQAKFDIFPEEVDLRNQVAARYSSLFAASSELVRPTVPAGYESVWAQYSLLARDEGHRQEIFGRMAAAGVPYAVHYPKPLHRQPAFAFLGYAAGDFPVSEGIATRIFSLPMHPYLVEKNQETIARAVLGA